MVHLTALSVFLLTFLGAGRTDTLSKLIDDSNNQYALDIYQALQNYSQNIITSPISMKILLGLVHQGAGGATAAEIAKVLHHPIGNVNILDSYRAMIKELENPNLKTATNIFVDKSFKIYPNFQNVSTTYFLSELKGVDFKGNPEGSRKEINDWVENHTNHKIRDLFSKDSLSQYTRLALVNAIHFKDVWKYQFKVKNTRDELFYITPTQAVNVKMMSLFHENLAFSYNEKLQAQILELHYKVKEFKMIIILPYEYDGLHKVESKLPFLNISKEMLEMQKGNIDVDLPKFIAEQKMELEEIHQKLGMPTAFSDQADFSKISNEYLKINKIVQKASIEVNEEGAEAAAASGTDIVLVSLPPRIRCDHPFMYMILKGNNILFIGRLVKPEGQVKNVPAKKFFG